MTYLSETEFRSYYTPEFINQLVNDSRDDPTSDESARIVTALESSDSIIDSYISYNYDTPLTIDPIPGVIKEKSKVLTLYNLSGRRWHDTTEPNKFERDYRDAISWLKSVKDGKVEIPGVPSDVAEDSALASGTSSTPLMERNNISDFY